MFSLGALQEWKRQAHGPRVQAKALCYIAKQLEVVDFFSDDDANGIITMTSIFKDCKERCVPGVSVTTIRRWWNIYEEWGELPSKVAERKKKINADCKFAKKMIY